jgi:hypothetical protein
MQLLIHLTKYLIDLFFELFIAVEYILGKVFLVVLIGIL